MTADVRQELAVHRVLYDLIVDHPMWIDGKGRGLDYSPERESRIGDFLDSAVEVLAPVVADAEKRAAAAAAHEWQGHLTTVLADLLRMTYSVQLDSATDAARKESERVADAFRARISDHCRERDTRIRAARAAALDPSGAVDGAQA